MRYKDKPKKRKLKASDEIRQKYAAKPIIALYQDEADAIIDNVLEESMIGGFYEWLGEWKKFIFKEANFVIKPHAKGESMYLAYSVKMDSIKITAFSDTCDDYTTWEAFPEMFDIEDMSGFVKAISESGDVSKTITLSTSKADYEEINAKRVKDAEYYNSETKRVMGEAESIARKLDEMKPRAEQIVISDPNLSDPSNKVFGGIYNDLHATEGNLIKEAQSIIDMGKSIGEHWILKLVDAGKRRTALTVLTTLYYFQIRIPKTYLDGNEAHTEGYKKHNDLYNPLKRLHPPAIVRPRNGTRSWFEQQRMRHTESWHVKGHSRVLRASRYKEKRGQTIWINPFVKGSGEGMRLSIYADQIAGKDVVEVEEIGVV